MEYQIQLKPELNKLIDFYFTFNILPELYTISSLTFVYVISIMLIRVLLIVNHRLIWWLK